MSGNTNSEVENLVDVVGKMGDEVQRLKDLSAALKDEQDTSDPMEGMKRLETMMKKLLGENQLAGMTDKLKAISEKYSTLTEEEKAEFEATAREKLGHKMAEVKEMAGMLTKTAREEAIETYSYITIIVCVLIVVAIFAFFGYKLYKSLKDKEVKREEKKKLKQLKKKK